MDQAFGKSVRSKCQAEVSWRTVFLNRQVGQSMSRQNVFRPIAFGQLPSGQLSFGQLSFGQLPLGLLPHCLPRDYWPNDGIGQLPFGRTTVGQMSWNCPLLSISAPLKNSSCLPVFFLFAHPINHRCVSEQRSFEVWCYQKKTDKDFSISIKINQTRWKTKTTAEAQKSFNGARLMDFNGQAEGTILST